MTLKSVAARIRHLAMGRWRALLNCVDKNCMNYVRVVGCHP
jgi:hypothetical protein